ncbi:hypothetical protein DM02DRAFT_620467 [Periconia macrospinosa]|uniref:Uncharacterized protein n=1 Tax=Periconia macrospinosa TaxID=97972 RepID=A0A2V1D2Q0_9PLEO|nr:hypothetical protein DM02DRAFT_620467 [Periconia macrospinosa]
MVAPQQQQRPSSEQQRQPVEVEDLAPENAFGETTASRADGCEADGELERRTNMEARTRNWHRFIPVIDMLGTILAMVASAEAAPNPKRIAA